MRATDATDHSASAAASSTGSKAPDEACVEVDTPGGRYDIRIGSGLIVGTSISYAIYLVGNTGLIRRLGATRFTGMAASISSVFVLAHYFAQHSPRQLHVPASLYMTVLGLSLVSTAIPIWMTSEALRLIGPSRVAIISSIGPIVTIWMGAVFLGETVNAVTYLGAALVLGGVALVTTSGHTG